MGLDKSVPIDYLHLTLVDGSSVTAMHVRLCVCVRGWVCMCVCVKYVSLWCLTGVRAAVGLAGGV